ncbi:TonB-dependent siderophore receptor [Pseudomonas aeruginosa]|nr:TonB-dependent siderophore receptor [Pseudomonas aeruginosa]
MTEAALASADAPHAPQVILQLLAKLGIACREVSDSAELPAARRVQAVLLDDAVGTLLVLFPQSQLLDLARLTELTGRKLLAIKPERLERMLGKHELHRLPALPPLTSSPCLYDERLLQEPRLLIESGQPGILLEIASNDFRGLLGKASAARFGEPLENINLNLDRPDDDRAEISQAVQAFTARRIQQRLEQTIEIPPLPQTAQKIIKLRVDPNASVDDITGLVETDPALAAQVVSWAASPYYAAPGKIRSVEDAIVRVLGFDLVINLALGLALGKSLSLPKDQPQQATPYWQQAIYTAAVIEGLTRAMPRELRPESGLSYLGGLLHNFGYLVLAHVFPPHFSLICRHLEVNPHLGHAYIEQHLLGITREQIDDTASKTVQQAMRYTPGIFTGQVGASNRYDYVVMRGFADNSVDNIYLDGLKAMGDSGTFSSMQVDPYFLERIDVLKGPSSVLYGRSLPGGLVALTSKKPLYEDYRQITGSIGNMGQKEMGFDFSGPLDEEKRIAYRLIGLGKGSDTQFDHVKEERYAIAPTLAIDFSDDTTLTLQGYLQHDPNGGYHGGVPADGTLSHHNGRHISREFFDGEPSKDDFDRTQRMFGYQLEHRIDDVWSARQNFRYLDSDVDLSQVYAYGWSASEPNKLNRYFSGAREHLQAYIVDNMLQAEFATGAARHTLLTGLDYQRRRTVVDWRSGSASALDAFNPVYGDDAISYFPDDNHTRRLEQTGVYLQDLIDIDQWRFSLGLRQDWVSVTDKNRSTGSKADDDWEKFTGRIGALYLFDNGLAPYVSYSESFNPNAYSDASGTPLAPTEGKQWELGLKFQAPGSNSFYTASLFHITQENVASKEPQDNFYTSVGEVRSQGLELEAHTQLSDNLKLLGSYTYTDITYTKSLDGNQGHTPNQAPKHMASLWADYAFDAGPLSGLSIGGGARYVGETWADKENTLRVPDYTLVDARIGYDLGKIGLKGLDVSLNANNLLDKDYVASCYSLDFCYFGEKRNVTATVNYQF